MLSPGAAGSVAGTASQNRAVFERAFINQRATSAGLDAIESGVLQFAGDRGREEFVGRCDSVVEGRTMPVGRVRGEERQQDRGPGLKNAAPLTKDAGESSSGQVYEGVAGDDPS